MLMNKFLKNLIAFATVIIFVRIVTFTILNLFEKKINKNIYNHPDIAIVGNSQTRNSINDMVLGNNLSKSAKNYGQGGQSIFWSIIGSRKLAHQGVDYFLINITNSTYGDDWKTITLQRVLRESQKVYFLKLKDWIYLFKKDFFVTATLLFKTIKPSKTVKGRFLTLDRKFKNVNLSQVKEHSRRELTFDDSIIHDFIIENSNCHIILFRAPQHPAYYKQLDYNDDDFKSKLKSFGKYPNCLTLDFGHYYSEDSLFMDPIHLNKEGSKIFTKTLSDTLLSLKIIK